MKSAFVSLIGIGAHRAPLQSPMAMQSAALTERRYNSVSPSSIILPSHHFAKLFDFTPISERNAASRHVGNRPRISPHHHFTKRFDFMLKNFAQEHKEGAFAQSSASSCSNLNMISPHHHFTNLFLSFKPRLDSLKSESCCE
ncbi:MAG: hypothetical protein NTW21_03235 [Verrucomicrobia bacterium]|nr:hypothetical protein [Verrucomicrobiota bacterium]